MTGGFTETGFTSTGFVTGEAPPPQQQAAGRVRATSKKTARKMPATAAMVFAPDTRRRLTLGNSVIVSQMVLTDEQRRKVISRLTTAQFPAVQMESALNIGPTGKNEMRSPMAVVASSASRTLVSMQAVTSSSRHFIAASCRLEEKRASVIARTLVLASSGLQQQRAVFYSPLVKALTGGAILKQPHIVRPFHILVSKARVKERTPKTIVARVMRRSENALVSESRSDIAALEEVADMMEEIEQLEAI